jgi:hypothetical protein
MPRPGLLAEVAHSLIHYLDDDGNAVCKDSATNFVLQEFSETDEMLFEAKGKRGPTTPATRSCNEHMRRRSPTLRALASPGGVPRSAPSLRGRNRPFARRLS